MITLKSAREIEAMDRAGDFLASIHIGLRDVIKPGVDMWEVEEYVRRRCKEKMFFRFKLVLMVQSWITHMLHVVVLTMKWLTLFHVTTS